MIRAQTVTRERTREHAWDFVRAVVWAQFRTEFEQYMLGWVWWILEPITYSLTFLFIVALFFRLPGDRLGLILVSVVAWRWFARSVEASPYLARQFAPYLNTSSLSLELMFVTFLAKEALVFVIAMVVIGTPTMLLAHAAGWQLLALPMIFVTQCLVTYWVSAIAMVVGALIQDVGKIVGLLVSIWWYFSPGLYIRSDLAHAPRWILTALTFNPFWAILASWQNVLVSKTPADLKGMLVWIAVSLSFTVVTHRTLERWRRRLVKAATE